MYYRGRIQKDMTKETCQRNARELCKKLGPGWKPYVWENLGWHYCAENTQMVVYAQKFQGSRVKYNCMLSDDPEYRHCGSSLWTDGETFNDPIKAVKHTLEIAEKEVNKLTKIIKTNKKAFYGD